MRPKFRFLELANRLTGFSTPIFGASWNPPTLDVEVTRQLTTFLEDRRILYLPYDREEIDFAARSILQIRERLSTDLEKLDKTSDLAKTIAAMRAECRKFLNKTQHIDTKDIRYSMRHLSRWDEPDVRDFFAALGFLRATLGFHIAQIAAKYGIDVEAQLVEIFPAMSDDENEQK